MIADTIRHVRIALYARRIASALVWSHGVDRKRARNALRLDGDLGPDIEASWAEGAPISLLAAALALDPELDSRAWRESRRREKELADLGGTPLR